jgi:hypothetical protein
MGGLILRILIGLGIAAGGAFMTIRTKMIIDFIGPVGWIEAKVGFGSSALFYKLLGIAFSLIGFLVATNLWDAFLQATLGGLFPSAPV